MAPGDAPAGTGVELEILAVGVWTSEGAWLRLCVDGRSIVYALVGPEVYPPGWQHENVKHAPQIQLPYFAKEWVDQWNVSKISRNSAGIYFSATTNTTFRGVGTYTHTPTYEYLTLEQDGLLHKGIRWNYHDRLTVVKNPVGSDGKPIWGVPLALMKIVPFPCELYDGLELTKRMDVEIRVHERAAMLGCAPRFIGLVVESSRVIGYLSEFLPNSQNFGEIGNELSREDGQAVLRLLEKLHANGMVHNDLHAGNILRDANGAVALIDFEMASTRESCDNPEQFKEYVRRERLKFHQESMQWPAARTHS